VFKQKKWCVGVGVGGGWCVEEGERRAGASGRFTGGQLPRRDALGRAGDPPLPLPRSQAAAELGEGVQQADKLQCLLRNSGAGLAVSSAGNISLPAHSILHAIVHITAEATYSRRHNGCLTAGQADRYGAGHDTARGG